MDNNDIVKLLKRIASCMHFNLVCIPTTEKIMLRKHDDIDVSSEWWFQTDDSWEKTSPEERGMKLRHSNDKTKVLNNREVGVDGIYIFTSPRHLLDKMLISTYIYLHVKINDLNGSSRYDYLSIKNPFRNMSIDEVNIELDLYGV